MKTTYVFSADIAPEFAELVACLMDRLRLAGHWVCTASDLVVQNEVISSNDPSNGIWSTVLYNQTRPREICLVDNVNLKPNPNTRGWIYYQTILLVDLPHVLRGMDKLSDATRREAELAVAELMQLKTFPKSKNSRTGPRQVFP